MCWNGEQRAWSAALTHCKRFSNEAQTGGETARRSTFAMLLQQPPFIFFCNGKTNFFLFAVGLFSCRQPFSDGTVGMDPTLWMSSRNAAQVLISHPVQLDAESLQFLTESSSPNWAKQSSGSPSVRPSKARRWCVLGASW